MIESDDAFSLVFSDEVKPPSDDETYKLSIKTLPGFDTEHARTADLAAEKKVFNALDEMIDRNRCRPRHRFQEEVDGCAFRPYQGVRRIVSP